MRAKAIRDRVSLARRWCVVSLSLMCVYAQPEAFAQRVIYVKADATGTQIGTTWTDAYTDLQDALDDARTNGDCPCEVWISAGTYKPDRGTGDRFVAFEPLGGVSLYGGFAGGEECLDQRDRIKNETTLTGDLLGDDDLDLVFQSPCYYPTRTPACDDPSCAALVIARHGYCAKRWDLFCALDARRYCCPSCRAQFADNAFNVVRVFDADATVVLDGLTVRGANGISAPPSPYSNGDAVLTDRAEVLFENCTFTRNASGGVETGDGTPVFRRCRFEENGFLTGGVAAFHGENQAQVTDCEFLRNFGGGMATSSSLPITRCRFEDNSGYDSGLTILRAAPKIVDCKFIANTAVYGGGLAIDFVGRARVERCVFMRNNADNAGAIDNSGALTIIDTLIVGNTAGNYAAINSDGALLLQNTVVYGNHAYGNTGGVAGTPKIMNSVIWGNYDRFVDEYGYYERNQISGLSDPDIHYSIVQNWSGQFGGVGNSGVDPLFVDADGADNVIGTEDDDLRLSPDSPAINAGDPDFVAYEGETDLDGHARVLCDRVDIGAYEFGIGDYDCNRTVDLTDFTNWPACMTGPTTSALLACVPPCLRASLTTSSLTPQAPSPCDAFDFNADADVDLYDLHRLLGVLQPQ